MPFNVVMGFISLSILSLLVEALLQLYLHPWLIPIIAVPILAWAFISTITHP